MTRWLPSPLASAVLLALWLLFNQSVSPAHLIFGGVLALAGPLLLRALDVPAMRVRRPRAIMRLARAVMVDVLRSNMKVTRVILASRPDRTPGFVDIPLRLRAPYGLVTLACIITATPGTSWVSFDAADGTLVIHVLDLADDDDWAAIIKNRYEGLLMEIFE